ncbi:MAG TPA: hypothetical protein VLK35_14275 [Methylomirabilota bacterium]|nr:hypothetical protein [Methylomirabilota bacterium]
MKALARTLIVLLAMAWPSSTAVALDIRFDDVTSVGNPLVTELEIHGYRFTGVFRTIDTPGTVSVTNGSAVYLGQEPGAPGLTVSRSDGGPFALYEFDAAGPHLVPPAGSPNAQRVAVVGLRIDGTLLEASFMLSELPAFAHFWVPSSWHDLRIVTFTGLLSSGGPGALAIDDVGVGEGPTSVSEPGTLALVLITALGGGAAVLTRHRGPASLWRR